jgi:hypothetical protein
MEPTYQELALNDKRTIELTAYTTTGEAFIPSGASYLVRNLRHAIIISKTDALINANKIYFQISLSITASAGEYEVIWELRKNGDFLYHCTRLLVNEAC